MRFLEREMSFPKIDDNRDLLSYLKEETSSRLGKEGLVPIRVSVTDSSDSIYHCEVGALHTVDSSSFEEAKLVFHFRKRRFENTKDFNVVFLIPTGIGCEIGGHAGDATPVARLLSSTCDNLITHPNVYNASDLNEMSDNSLYVEGSTISRLMMGTVGLQPVRCNRILAVIDNSDYSFFETAAVNSVNAARAVLGIVCSDIVKLDPSIVMKSRYSSSERAVGAIDGIDNLFAILKSYEGTYDAVAISTTIDVPKSYHTEYFRRRGDMVNPWGGVEAMLTHAISYKLNIPSAHSPMFESPQIANEDPGIVEARMSAEAVSTTFLHCVLKGLHKSPKIITDQDLFGYDDIISAENISCLVIPNGCLGLPTLAALKQGIKVIAVKENKNLMRNDLNELPWKSQQFFQVENYLEAAGVLSSIKNGIDTRSVRRPFKTMDFDNSDTSNDLVH